MSACHAAATPASDFFVVVLYRADAEGMLDAEVPASCPGSLADGRSCRIARHDFRVRKTGPCHALRIFQCKAHHGYFTAYPPGHVPYGRKPLVVLGPDGAPVTARSECFAGTLFDAAREAAEGRAWRRPVDQEWSPHREARLPAQVPPEGPVWSTQVRHIDRATQLLGLGLLDTDGRLAFAEILTVDTLVLHEQSGDRGYRAQGRAVEAVLGVIQARIFDARLAEAGAMAGLWAIPLHWDGRTQQLRRRPFRTAGMPRPRRGPSRARGDP